MALRTTCCSTAVASAAARQTGRCTSTNRTSKLPLLATAARRLTGLAPSEIRARRCKIGVVPGCGITRRPSAVGVLFTRQPESTPRQVLSRRGYHALNNNPPAVVMRLTAVGQSRLKHGAKKGGKGGKGGGNKADDEEVSLDDFAGIPETKARYDKCLEGLKNEFQGLRGGRTDPGMLDHVQVDSYGSTTNLAAVAQITLKGPQLMVLTVYDPDMTAAVQKAVRDCGMNLNPITEGPGQVNVPIPKPTKESREEVAKIAGKAAEKTKVVLRGIRHKILDQIKKNKEMFPEDDVHARTKEIDKCTKEAEERAGKMLEKKRKEIMMV